MREQGKTKEILKEFEEKLHKDKYVFVYNNEELKKHNKQIINDFTQKLIDMLTERAELINFSGNYSEFMFSVYDLQESIKQLESELC